MDPLPRFGCHLSSWLRTALNFFVLLGWQTSSNQNELGLRRQFSVLRCDLIYRAGFVFCTAYVLCVLSISDVHGGGWRDGSLVKNAYCSYRGPEFESQSTCQGAQLPLSPVRRALMPSSGTALTRTTPYTGTHLIET